MLQTSSGHQKHVSCAERPSASKTSDDASPQIQLVVVDNNDQTLHRLYFDLTKPLRRKEIIGTTALTSLEKYPVSRL